MLKTILTLIASLVVSTASLAASDEIANPFIGTWDIDLVESNFGSATPPKNLSRTYFDHDDGTYTYIVVTTAPDDTISATSARYSYSGEEYPIASFNQEQSALISYNRINDSTVEYTVNLNGEVSQIGAKFISPNYQRLSISIQYPATGQDNQILVFNRRR